MDQHPTPAYSVAYFRRQFEIGLGVQAERVKVAEPRAESIEAGRLRSGSRGRPSRRVRA